jgi:hypothetical protein
MDFVIGPRKNDKKVIVQELADYESELYAGKMNMETATAIAKKNAHSIYGRKCSFLGLYAENGKLLGFSMFRVKNGEFIIHDIIIIDKEEYLDYVQENFYEYFIHVLENYAILTGTKDIYFELNPYNEALKSVCAKSGYEVVEEVSEDQITMMQHKVTPYELEAPKKELVL